MNWIIYAILGAIKLLIVSVLVLISVFLMPVVILLFSLGIALCYLRDVEPTIYTREFPSFVFDNLSFTNLKSMWLNLHLQIQRIQHLLINRDKPIF